MRTLNEELSEVESLVEDIHIRLGDMQTSQTDIFANLYNLVHMSYDVYSKMHDILNDYTELTGSDYSATDLLDTVGCDKDSDISKSCGHRYGSLFVRSVKRDDETGKSIAVVDCLHLENGSVKTFYAYLEDITSGSIVSCPECSGKKVVTTHDISDARESLPPKVYTMYSHLARPEDRLVFLLRFINKEHTSNQDKLNEEILSNVLISDGSVLCNPYTFIGINVSMGRL